MRTGECHLRDGLVVLHQAGGGLQGVALRLLPWGGAPDPLRGAGPRHCAPTALRLQRSERGVDGSVPIGRRFRL